VADTMPFIGAIAPVHTMGVVHVEPEYPVPSQSQVKESPISVQVPPFKHGFGVHGATTGSHVGGLPVQAPLAWQMRVLDPPLPVSTKPSSHE
jgi:hypothetical protein